MTKATIPLRCPECHGVRKACLANPFWYPGRPCRQERECLQAELLDMMEAAHV